MIRRDIENLAALLGSSTRPSGGNMQMSCPYASFTNAHRGHDLHYSFGVSISQSRSKCNCFTCRLRGDLTAVFGWLLKNGCVSQEVFEFVRDVEKCDISSIARRLGTTPVPLPEKKKEFNLVSFVRQCQRQVSSANEFFAQRGLLPQEVKKFGLGYDDQKGRVVFPVQARGRGVVGCIGRSTNGDRPKYYKYPTNRDDVFMGEHLVDVTLRGVYLVEGPMDWIKASRVFPNVLALNGLYVTEQKRERLSTLADEVTLLLDSDTAGMDAIDDLGKYLCRKLRVFVMLLPSGKDPAEATEEELLTSFQNRMMFYQ